MKKKIYAILIFTVILFVMAGCGGKDDASGNAELRDEIIKFVNEDLAAISADRDSAVQIYNSYFGGSSYTDSSEWVSKLESEALVSYSTYLNNLQTIEVTSTEVQELKSLFLQSSQLQYDAMSDVVNAVKNQDTTLLDSAQDKIEESNKYFAQYETKLKELADANGITINGSFTMINSSTPQDADMQ